MRRSAAWTATGIHLTDLARGRCSAKARDLRVFM